MEFQENLIQNCRQKLFRICVVAAIAGLLAEILVYWYHAANNSLFLPAPLYRARFIYLPAGLNLLVIVVTACFLNHKRLTCRAKNLWACILVFGLCAGMQCVHYLCRPLLLLPCIAILVTTLFADKRLTKWVSAASLISLMLTFGLSAVEFRRDDPQLGIDTLLALIITIFVCAAALLLTNYSAEQLRFSLTIYQRQKELLEECNLDPLMGIRNRRALEDRLASFTQNPPKEGLTHLLMLDIDDFKKVNDSYGHPSGDTVLVNLVETVKQNSDREHIQAFRFGGEEIVLIINDLDRYAAYELCEDIRKSFAESVYPFAPKRIVTFSGGFVSYQHGVTGNDLLKMADKALYHAKAEGKNCIVLS